MSTTKTTTSSTNFNPGSVNTYNSLIGSAGSALTQNINNPTSNSFFQSQVGNMSSAVNTMGANSNAALVQRSNALGISQNSPAFAAQMGQNQRQVMANQGQGYNNLLLGALGTRMQSLNTAMNFRPLQTGGTQVQSTGGLGQYVGLAGAAANGGMTAASNLFGQNGGFNYWAGNNASPMGQQSATNYSNLQMPNFGSGVSSNFGNPNGPNPFMPSGAGY
jgi:hypothetical protein